MKHLTPAHYGLLVILIFFSITLSAQITVEVVGPNTATVGQTKNYTVTWRNGGSTISPLTTGTFYWWAMGGTPSAGTNASGSVLWTAAGPKIVGFEYTTPTNYYAHDYLVTVSDVTPTTPATTFTTTRYCGNTVVKRLTGPPVGITWYWQTSSTGTLTTLGSGESITRTSAGALYLRARNSSGTWSTAQSVGSITLISTPPVEPTTAYPKDAITNTATPVTLSVSAVSGATTYRWYSASTGGSMLREAASITWSPSLAATKTYYVASYIDSCGSTTRKPVTATIHPLPVITSTNNGVATMGDSVTLSLNYSYDAYQWKKNGTNISGATASTHETNQAGDYSVAVTKGNSASAAPTTIKKVFSSLAGSGLDMNYIISETILVEGVTNAASIDALPVEQNAQTIQYFDGLGRPIQSVITRGSPQKKDIVQPVAYDAFGRDAVKYLPYVSTASDGWYKSGFIQKGQAGYTTSPQYMFYNNGSSTVAQDNAPFSETLFEASPLNRPDKDFGAGAAWHTNNKNIQHGYLVNQHSTGSSSTQEKIIAWTIGSGLPVRAGIVTDYIVTGGYYATGQLSIKSTKDEQGNEVREYTNKSGQVILKKVQASAAGSSNLNSTTDWALTYYVYDDFDNLRFVFPPELSRLLHTNSDNYTITTNDLSYWAFQYTYDSRKRMITKQVPGAGAIYMVYDNRDRLVLTQDANQRAKNEWLFTKYDTLNRPVMTGIYKHGSNVTRATMSTLISTSKFAEKYDNTKTHGYTTSVFPTTNLTVLSATYYDTYNFQADFAGGSYTFDDDHLDGQEETHNPAVTGQVTGSKINILGTSNYLWSVSYYDDKYRVIQTTTQNHLGSTDRITNIYDFTGKVLSTKSTHSTTSAGTDITRTLKYDHAGRLLNTFHKINDEDAVLLAQNHYNELGQLIDKKLHARNEEDFAQDIAYRYNIRGWLTSINDPAINATALFNFQLKYNNPTANGGTAQYNGNISETSWKTAGHAEASYGYEYDAMNRLTESQYSSAGRNNRFNENILNVSNPAQSAYDLNGNILFLQRTGKTGANTFGNLDNLTYSYTGNQLTRVDDAITTAAGQDGFKELVKTANEYTYDANGNMITDANKGITQIKYNHLNLPRMVKKSGADSIVYTYDAGGRKLKQQVYGAKPKTTTYAGEYIYENDTLRFINHEEGRILKDTLPETDYDWEYQYHLKDHLGNVRVTFSEKNTTTQYEATMEKSPSSIETEENAEFLNMNSTKKLAFYNHTPGAGKSYSYRLSGSSTEVVGPAKSLEVNAGDIVDLEVYARYANLTNTNSSVNTLLTSLISAFGLPSSGGSGLTSEDAYNSFSTIFSGGPVIGGTEDYEDEEAPKAYLNYILFDENFIPVDFGFDQVSESAGTAHEYLSLNIKVEQKGYLYIYLSNENDKLVDVFFDDLNVTHHTGVEQSDDYYAFGLNFNSYQRENSIKNNYLYNGKELQDELGLGWTDYGPRMYLSDIGRWGVIDPLSDKMRRHSPYNYAYDNPIRFIDPDGMAPVEANGEEDPKKKEQAQKGDPKKKEQAPKTDEKEPFSGSGPDAGVKDGTAYAHAAKFTMDPANSGIHIEGTLLGGKASGDAKLNKDGLTLEGEASATTANFTAKGTLGSEQNNFIMGFSVDGPSADANVAATVNTDGIKVGIGGTAQLAKQTVILGGTIAGIKLELTGTVLEGGVGGRAEVHSDKSGFGGKILGEVLVGLGFSFDVSW